MFSYCLIFYSFSASADDPVNEETMTASESEDSDIDDPDYKPPNISQELFDRYLH